jgi:hypothetical protein
MNLQECSVKSDPKRIGHPRDAAAWRALHEYANSSLSWPGNGLADLHVILAQVVMCDEAVDTRARQIEALAREGRYPSGFCLSALGAYSLHSNAGIFPLRSRHLRRSRARTNELAVAALNTT